MKRKIAYEKIPDSSCWIYWCNSLYYTVSQDRDNETNSNYAIDPDQYIRKKNLYSSGERNLNGSITFSLPISQATFYFWSVPTQQL